MMSGRPQWKDCWNETLLSGYLRKTPSPCTAHVMGIATVQNSHHATQWPAYRQYTLHLFSSNTHLAPKRVRVPSSYQALTFLLLPCIRLAG